MPSEIGKTTSDNIDVDWIPTVVRFGSSTSSQASQNSGDICRICHCESDPLNPLLTPCYCCGSLKFVHQACLQQWLTASETNACELCKFPFIMHTKIKPFNEWRSLDMSGVERRRLFCAVLFHCAAALCVIWSLCVLIERATEEVKKGLIGWPFWTKLVVVTVGLTGGVVFMYIQCRQYLHLCNRWRARNRILLIQNAPEKIHLHHSQSPVLQSRLPRNSSSSTTGMIIGSSCGGGNNNNFIRPQLQGQIIANIENNPNQYERDWTLDDVSQVSFKPCPQGSGSLTPLPFHESVHNMCEIPQSLRTTSSSNSSHHSSNENQLNQPTTVLRTNDLSLFKINSQQQIKFPNSAVFLENRDILNDQQTYPKMYHRHSAVLLSPDLKDKFLGKVKDTRRYSDTKLLQQQNSSASNSIFNVTNLLGPTIITTPIQSNEELMQQTTAPQITDIIFETNTNFDPLELNIQELLELDVNQQNLQKKSQLSLNQEIYCDVKIRDGSEIEKKKYLFKSLPNLSASSENLLQ